MEKIFEIEIFLLLIINFVMDKKMLTKLTETKKLISKISFLTFLFLFRLLYYEIANVKFIDDNFFFFFFLLNQKRGFKAAAYFRSGCAKNGRSLDRCSVDGTGSGR